MSVSKEVNTKMALNETSVHSVNGETSQEILQFLKEGEGKLEIGKFKNVTLVLGITGSGKSTFTQFLTGNYQGLYAVETAPETGEFTIHDRNHKVCRGTLDSCTIIPTLFTDKETNSGFYDCPGFGDTRSVKHDISVTYFIKKVIDSVDSVKLLFTVNHNSVTEGGDRRDFMMLVKNIIKMVKDVEKFKNSITLVVTKVDNNYVLKKRQFFLVPDEAVIRSVVNFLEKAKESLEDKVREQSKTEDHIFYSDAIKFINILLEKNGNDYSRIGLFRRPEEEGPLDRSTLMLSGKARIKKMLQSFEYVRTTSGDFGYTVSAESLNQMHDLVDRVNEKLWATFNAMGRSIMEHYAHEEMASRDVEELSKILTSGHEGLSEVRGNRNYQSSMDLCSELQKFAHAENVIISMEDVADVVHYDSFLRFLNQFSSGLRTTSNHPWMDGLREAMDMVSDGKEWLNLLVNLQTKLSDFTVFSDIRRDPRSLNALVECIDGKISGSEDGKCDLEGFLRHVFKNHLEKEYANARKVQPNVHEWALLGKLLDFSLESTCGDVDAGSVLIINGRYVKFSDINGKSCKRSIKSIKLMVHKKVFIDESYSWIGEKMEVVIMAPYWEVVGSHTITLDGASGGDHWPRKAADGSKSRWFTDMNGAYGSSGKDGGEGGLFWGMAQHCKGCERLTVTANGGQGGAGQDGGDGAKGYDFHSQYEGDQHGLLITVFYNKKVSDIKYYGQRGGNGGNGGNGGQGGPKGMVKFNRFGQGSVPVTSAVHGRPGRPGAGGAPGKGGRSVRRIHQVQTVLFVPWWGDEDQSLPTASDGFWGQNGRANMLPTTSTGKFSDPPQTLGHYIMILKAKINNLSDASEREFLHNLENFKIDDVKHHVGRRSVMDTVSNKTNFVPSFITKFFTFISNMVDTRYKPGTLPSNTRQPISNSQLSFQGIGQHQKGIPQIASFSDVPAVGSRFDASLVQSNLLLLDYLHRMSKRGRGESKKTISANKFRFDGGYAQRTAYAAQIPRHNVFD